MTKISECGKISAAIATLLLLCSCENARYREFYRGLPFEMEEISLPRIPSRSLCLNELGGRGDGIFDNTEAFAAGIGALGAKGGGHLIVPEGIWCTGPIHLESGIDLHLEENAVIVFKPDLNLYPIVTTSFEGLDTRRCTSPINAKGARNISITGKGVIDGSGEHWRPLKKSKVSPSLWKSRIRSGGYLNDKGDYWMPDSTYVRGEMLSERNLNVPVGEFDDGFWESIKAFLRPVMVSLVECENILLQGVTFQNSPAWNIHPLLCRNLTVDGITVRNPSYSQNGDGIDIESCENVLLVNSSFDVGDDAICIKSGKDENGRRRARPTRNLAVDNCTVYHGHGGFVVGSEMSGGVENVSVRNCRFLGTDVGLRFKSKRGRGGVVSNIHVEDIYMKDIVTEPLLFDLYYGGMSAVEAKEKAENEAGQGRADRNAEAGDEVGTARPGIPAADETTPEFRDIHIQGVVCKGAGRAFFFNGLPEKPIRNVTLEDCVFSSDAGGEIREAEDIALKNVRIVSRDGKTFSWLNVHNLRYDGGGYSSIMADSELRRCPEASLLDGLGGRLKWNYTTGLELLALLNVYEQTGEARLLDYVYDWYDAIIDSDGNIATYSRAKHNVDHICPARTLFTLMKYRPEEKFRKAMDNVYAQIAEQPRTSEGGFYHKDIYPHQMWLDGLYMAQPFYALYAQNAGTLDKAGAYRDIAGNFRVCYNHCLDPETGLLRHAWDESRGMFWCDSVTGQSAHSWGRAMGWFTMALLDVTEIISGGDVSVPEVAEEVDMIRTLLPVIRRFADPRSGMWHQVLDSPGREGNYLEASCSAMFTYSFLKAARLGLWEDTGYAGQSYRDFVKQFVRMDPDGTISIRDCCAVAGLGGKDNRPGTFEYYIGEKIVENDCKAVGPFIWASLEYEDVLKLRGNL